MIRRFGPEEIEGADEPVADAELASAWAAARALEAIADASGLAPTDGFADRVMSAVAGEPLPAPVAAAGHAVRQGRLAAAVAAFADAWRVALGGGRPLGVRARSFAVVLVVVVAFGAVGGLALVRSWNALAPAGSPAASAPLAPSESPSPSPSPTPSPSATPSLTPTPGPSATPSQTPEPSDTGGPPATPAATSDGGSGSGGAPATGRPTLRPTPTPSPTQHEGSQAPGSTHAPEPTQTPDAGGGGGEDAGGTASPTSGG